MAHRIGDRVYHFTNRETVVTVRAVQPVRDCGEYGLGNWLCKSGPGNQAFSPQALILVEYANGRTEWDFESYWESL